ncbi:MAG: hypothetical protein L6Q66_13875, partial [Bacteroidia bacterium]|nr:hypothetical protein [Bacteroidia bacterium]
MDAFQIKDLIILISIGISLILMFLLMEQNFYKKAIERNESKLQYELDNLRITSKNELSSVPIKFRVIHILYETGNRKIAELQCYHTPTKKIYHALEKVTLFSYHRSKSITKKATYSRNALLKIPEISNLSDILQVSFKGIRPTERTTV